MIGRDVRLDGRPHRIVGIMKPGSAFPELARCGSLGLDPDADPRDLRIHDSVARLAPGVEREQAGVELERSPRGSRALSGDQSRLERRAPAAARQWLPPSVRIALPVARRILLRSPRHLRQRRRAPAGAGERRSREMALRAALGAGRLRLVRQTITECTVLAPAGGVLGLPAAILLNRWVVSWAPARPPYLFA